MASIDSLNFEVILQDNNFEEKLKKLLDIAQKFNTSMTQALNISKVTNFQTSIRQTNTHLTNTASILRTVSQLTGVAFGAMGIRRFLSSLIDITGQFEVQKMALGAMLQDADKADKIFGQFRQLALESPYTFQEFTKFGKQLTAFNIPAEQLVGTTKMLADVAAGLGVDMQRIILAYGQIKSAGVLKGTELRQLTEAGVPILDELAKQIEKTTGKTVQLAEVFDMISKKQIPFAMVEQAFKDMTSEGGKFYNMQEVLVETLAGKIGKLKDTWQQALYDIGSAQSGLLKGSVDLLTNLVANYDKLGKAILVTVTALGAYKTAMAIATLAAKGYTAAEMALLVELKAAEVAQKAFNATVLKNPYAFIAAAVVAATAGLFKFAATTNDVIKSQKILTQINNEYEASLQSEQENLRILLERMDKLNPASEEYAKLKERLLSQYGQYLSAVDKENIAIGQLAGVYDTLAGSIEKTAMARAKDQGYQRLQDELTSTITDITKTFNNTYSHINSSEIKGNLLDFIFGRIDESQLVEGAKKYTQKTAYAASNLILELRDKYARAKQSVDEGNKALKQAFDKTSELLDGGEWPPKPTEWQLKVGRTIGGTDFFDIYGYKEGENWETYYTRMEGEYKKVSNDLLHSFNETDKKLYRERKEALEALNKEFGGALLAGSSLYNKKTRAEETEAERRRKKDIKGIKEEIELLRKYKDTYEPLADLIGEEGAKDLTNKIYKDINITDFNFIGQIIEKVQQLRALGDEEGANSVLSTLGLGEGKDVIKGLEQAQRTADAYKDLIRAMTTEDTDVDGKGFWYDLSKVTSDLETKLNKLTLQGQRAKEKLAGIDINDENQKAAVFKALADDGWTEKEISEFWDKWIADGRASIDEFILEAIKKAKAAASERVTDLAKVYVQEEYFIEGIDFDNLSQKTLGQLRAMKQKLFDIMTNLEIDEDTSDILAAYGIDPKNLADVDLDEFFKELDADPVKVLDDTTKSLLRLMKAAQKTGGTFEDFGDAVKKIVTGKLKDLSDEEKKALLQFGKFAVKCVSNVLDALGKLGDSGSSRMLADLAQGLEKAAEGVSAVMEGYKQGEVVGAVIAGVSTIATWALEGAAKIVELDNAIVEARMDMEKFNFEMALSEGVDSIFGENGLRKIANATKGIKDATKALKDLQEQAPKEFRNYNTWFERVFNEYTGYSLKEMADSVGGNLYDEYGNLNAKTLQTILDTYKGLKQSDKEWIRSAINGSENYKAALELLDGVINDVIGDITANAASAIVDQWKTAGDAALDYADILDSVATKYAEMAVQSLLLDEVFNEDMKESLRQAFKVGDMDKAMSIVADGMEAVTALAPQIEQVLEPLRPYIKETEGKDTENTLKAGINKELVEGNSSLIASYMNAMRADLSVVRNLQTSGWQDVRVIREMVEEQYTPTYNEYMAQIAANTYDMAQSNMEILSRIKSIITVSPSGGSAVRTTK